MSPTKNALVKNGSWGNLIIGKLNGLNFKISCNKTAEEMNDNFGHYLEENGMQNPYATDIYAWGIDLSGIYKKHGICPLGRICMYGSGNTIYIAANIGDENGGDVNWSFITASKSTHLHSHVKKTL